MSSTSFWRDFRFDIRNKVDAHHHRDGIEKVETCKKVLLRTGQGEDTRGRTDDTRCTVLSLLTGRINTLWNGTRSDFGDANRASIGGEDCVWSEIFSEGAKDGLLEGKRF